MKNISIADSAATSPLSRREDSVAERIIAWAWTPAGGLALLISGTLLARLAFASALGLGVDESYMVAAGRKLQVSYFDHPPISWWMAWAAAHLTGSSPMARRVHHASFRQGTLSICEAACQRGNTAFPTQTFGLASATPLARSTWMRT